MLTLKFYAMGCQMLAAIDRDDYQAEQQLAQVPSWFEDWEQSLSRFRLDSELSRLNQSQGEWFSLSETLWVVLGLALDAQRQSDGLVNPAILPVLEMAGYDRSFEQIRAQANSQATGRGARFDLDLDDIQIDEDNRAVCLPPGMRLDLGGVAKGWAAQEAMQRLAPLGPALVDASGDISVSAPRPGSKPWLIAVQDPFDDGEQLAMLAIDSGGVATSGSDYRRWRQDGVWRHHIIDPRSQQPAESDVVAATVVAGSLTEAEIWAKALLLMGSRAAMDWLEDQSGFEGLLALQNHEVQMSSGLRQYLEKE